MKRTVLFLCIVQITFCLNESLNKCFFSLNISLSYILQAYIILLSQHTTTSKYNTTHLFSPFGLETPSEKHQRMTILSSAGVLYVGARHASPLH